MCPTRAAVLAILLLLSGTVGGCTAIGPGTIRNSRFDYGDAISRSFNEQLLLNLVRLRYQDSVQFLDVTSVVSSYHREVAAGLTPAVGSDGALSSGGTGSFLWSETPTISYAPLQGEDFATRLLAPIQPSTILLLSRSGWGLERLLLCSVQQINDLTNGGYIGGVAPIQVRHYARFQRVAELLRRLQEEGFIQLSTLAGKDAQVVLAPGPTPFDEQATRWADEALALLRVDVEWGPVNVDPQGFPRKPASIMMAGRSLLGMMAFLAQHVEAPPLHLEQGLLRVTLGPDGRPFDWRSLSRGMFRVRSARTEPTRAYVKILYRDHWFWIDDADLETKSTYTLLGQLFWLQSASGKIQPPVLTLPVR